LKENTWLYWYWGKEDTVDAEIPNLVSLFQEKGFGRVLDLGCGTGRHVIYLAQKGFQVSAFDQSEAAITRVRQLLAERGLTANLKVWDMAQTPYPFKESEFDAVIAVRVIHHTNMATIRKIIDEMFRVTREGGYLYVQSPTYEKAIRQRTNGSVSEEVERGTFLPMDGEEKGVLHHHFTREELNELFKNITDLHEREDHYCLTAVKRSS